MKFIVLFGGIGILLGCWFFNTSLVWAVTKSRMELGLGIVTLQTPHYLGANHYYKGTLPFPVVIYRFEFLDRNNNFVVAENETFRIDFALSARVPVISDDEDAKAPPGANDRKAVIARLTNYTRRGMPDLPLALFLGAQIKWYLNDYTVIELPFVTGNAAGGRYDYVGNTFSPTLRFETLGRDSDNSLNFSLFWLQANEHYNDFYYRVKEKHVLDDRSDFDAESGLVSVNYGITAGWQITDRWVLAGAFFTHDMNQSIIRDSPLVISKISHTFGLSINYRFFLSDEKVQVD